ncbi:MAG: M56 family metallopeptidase [Hydrogenovibrio sp.]|uniref:M56 family metallopeptidase n=1 Tax=Hydrogenovibrio sp. TaxID=2065821 RepID=UPI0028703467|nr:M56 family metallopeptidase [Hydrogenovibrio sp.]MDR9499877.1 M56 family metallopeptidase [Hydrogenovibrio sp.]
MEWMNQFGFISTVFVLFWVAGQLLAALFARRLDIDNLKRQRRLIWLLASLPLILPTMILTALAAVDWAKHQGLLVQHCIDHQGLLFCVEKTVLSETLTAPVWIGLAGLVVVGLLFFNALNSLIHTQRKAHNLRRFTQLSSPLVKLEQPQANAFVLGLRQPIITWSQQLSRRLTKRQQRIVLAHEIAHIRRRDLVKNVGFELLLAFHIKPQALRKYWLLNMESQVDESLTTRFDRLDIAEVLLKLSRAHLTSQPGLSFTGSTTKNRIERLLGSSNVESQPVLEWLIWSLLGMTLLFTAIEHHSVEWLIRWIWL